MHMVHHDTLKWVDGGSQDADALVLKEETDKTRPETTKYKPETSLPMQTDMESHERTTIIAQIRESRQNIQ
jgi:hypothetical protein